MTTEYPKITPTKGGYKISMSDKMNLPGIYTSVFMAEKAILRYNGKMAEAKQNRKK